MSADRLDILFVDDEPRIVEGLRRQLRSQRDKWEMRFAIGADEALKMLAERPADIVISDMRMPRMNGGQFLGRVRELYPQTTRLLLSGQTDQADLLPEIGYVHQYLQKPCDGEALCRTIERNHILAKKLGQPALRQAANQVTALPPASQTYRALVDELAKPEPKLNTISNLVSSDPALTAKLIQLVNSSFFGMPRRVTSPREAVVLLGLRTIHSIVFTSRLFELAGQSTQHQVSVHGIWEASVAIGEAAYRLATKNSAVQTVASEAQLAGMLSLIGRVILRTSPDNLYDQVVARVETNQTSYTEAEHVVYGASQDEVTAYALGIWAFSDEVIEAVALQSQPTLLKVGKTNDLLAYLHLARALHTPMVSGIDRGPALDREFLVSHGYESLLPPELRNAA